MMNDITPFTIYWITRLDGIISACVVLSILLVIALSVMGGIFLGEYSSSFPDENVIRAIKGKIFACSAALVMLVLLSALIPSTKTAAAMYVVPRIVHDEKVQATANGLYDLAVKWFRETHNEVAK